MTRLYKDEKDSNDDEDDDDNDDDEDENCTAHVLAQEFDCCIIWRYSISIYNASLALLVLLILDLVMSDVCKVQVPQLVNDISALIKKTNEIASSPDRGHGLHLTNYENEQSSCSYSWSSSCQCHS